MNSVYDQTFFTDNDVTVGKFYATYMIQDYYRKFKKRKAERERLEGETRRRESKLDKDISNLQVKRSLCKL